MRFLAPSWLALAAVASLAAIAIHLIAWRTPRTVPLPTARFVPDQPSRYAARALRLSDLALLALRVLILMAGGLALARPVFSRTPSGAAVVIAVERSAGMPDTAVVRSRLADVAVGAGHRAFVAFDSVSHPVTNETETLGIVGAPGAPATASLSVGLLAAIREANRLAREFASVRIVVASTFTPAMFDAATSPIRALWPDSIRLLPLSPSPVATTSDALTLISSGDDPVVAGLELARSNGFVHGRVRVVRGTPSGVDSALADSGLAVVIWPRAPDGTTERADGIVTDGVTAIGHFLPLPMADSGRVIATWVDGSVAALQLERGTGCIRTIGFDLADAGDFALTPAFQRVAAKLVAPCQEGPSAATASDSTLQAIAAAPDSAAMPEVPVETHTANRIGALLLIAAMVLLLLEMLVRRRVSSTVPAASGAA